jgi:hypothetical protein
MTPTRDLQAARTTLMMMWNGQDVLHEVVLPLLSMGTVCGH